MSEIDHQMGRLIPPHMHRSLKDWLDKGEPSPDRMGDFLYSVLTNNLMDSFKCADGDNLAHMFQWCVFLHQFAPADAYGSIQAVERWYKSHHPQDEERGPDPMTLAKEG